MDSQIDEEVRKSHKRMRLLLEPEPRSEGHATACVQYTIGYGMKALCSPSNPARPPAATCACNQEAAIGGHHGSRHRWRSHHRLTFRKDLGGPECS